MSTTNNAVWNGLIDEAYESVSRMIWRIVHRYHKSFGGDLDELKSVADEGFMTALYSWDESKGAFTTHVWNNVYYALKNEATALRKKGGFVKERLAPISKDEAGLLHKEGDEGSGIDPSKLADRPHFDLASLLGDLSDEAKEVAQVALSLSSNGKPVSESYLAEIFHEAGWAASEFLRAFKEISEALLS